MTRPATALALFAASTFAFVGCDRPTYPAAAPSTTSPTPADKPGDVHVRTPGVSVDVEKKSDGKGVNVDVRTKDRRP